MLAVAVELGWARGLRSTDVDRLLDVISLCLLVGASAAFLYGLDALGARRDLEALYALCIGALALRASTDLLRPKVGAG